MVGVCGTGMRSVAAILIDFGFSVSGSDQAGVNRSVQQLIDRGLIFQRGHESRAIQEGTNLLVHSPAIDRENAELRVAQDWGILCESLPEFLARLSRGRTTVCVAGTHGKSTTTAMLAWILQSAGRDPTVFMGGELVDSGCAGRGGQDPVLVMETCEFRRGFLHQRPDVAVILNMEPDHFDTYPATDALTEAFREFAGRVSNSGRLLLPNSIAAVLEPISTDALRETFGDRGEATWSLERNNALDDGALARRRSVPIGPLRLAVPGRHNQLNALAAVALASHIGVSPADGLRAVGSFPGIRRRFERKTVRGGAIVIDDYAHHPTAVRASLETARHEYPARRIRAVFQPHQISRTERLMREFAEALTLADEVVILPVFAARESDAERKRAVSEFLAAEVRGLGGDARFEDSLDPIRHSLDDAEETAVVLTIGAGDIDQVYHADA